MDTAIVSSQIRTYGPQPITGYRTGAEITATVRFDDARKNRHNTFSITAEVARRGSYDVEAFGCLHSQVAEAFPELAPFLKWHLCSTDVPLHYIENTMYWLGRRGYTRPFFERAKETAIWPDMPENFAIDGTSDEVVQKALEERLPELLVEFRTAIEALGMTW